MDLMIMAKEIMEVKRDEAIGSKLNGRRNYVIRTDIWNGKICMINGTYKHLEENGWLCETLKHIVEHNTRWYYFTYKKDYEEVRDKIIEMIKMRQ